MINLGSDEHGAGDTPRSLAAMSVCEALLIALVEKGLLDWEEVSDALEAAVDAHHQASSGAIAQETHNRAAEEIGLLLRKLNALQCSGRN